MERPLAQKTSVDGLIDVVLYLNFSKSSILYEEDTIVQTLKTPKTFNIRIPMIMYRPQSVWSGHASEELINVYWEQQLVICERTLNWRLSVGGRIGDKTNSGET
jgi:hypothetical protein